MLYNVYCYKAKEKHMPPVKAPKKVNYLNNRDILKEIHKSKSTYCSYLEKEYAQYDIIVPSVDKINQRSVAEARRNKADRIKRLTGEILDPTKLNNQELVFRVVCWEHIPMVPKKLTKAQEKKKSKLEEILEMDNVNLEDDGLQDLMEEVEQDLNYVKLNFPPFYHYMIDEDKVPYLVGKSHWVGGMENGYFSKDHGKMTDKLAHMFIKLCERYATRSNWRGYTYNEEMRGQALLQLSQIGLQFDESKSQNPFAYYTAAITNSFTRVLNIEKKNQNIRDDILEQNGLNPSWTRQFNNSPDAKKLQPEVVKAK